MRLVFRSLPQMVVMAAIVTSALFVPVGALLIWLSFALFGVSLRAIVTFGSLLTALEGLQRGGLFFSSRRSCTQPA